MAKSKGIEWYWRGSDRFQTHVTFKLPVDVINQGFLEAQFTT